MFLFSFFEFKYYIESETIVYSSNFSIPLQSWIVFFFLNRVIRIMFLLSFFEFKYYIESETIVEF